MDEGFTGGRLALALALALAAAPGAAACPPGMARIPAGRYAMGQREGYEPSVGAFCLDRTEVTVAAYAACVARRACTKASATVALPGITQRAELDRWSRYCNADRADRRAHPANCVDWHQADAYCRFAGKRLATEEEWEWAARGARPKATYPWGNAPAGAQVCWNFDHGRPTGHQGTCPVGTHPGGDSPQGVKDLAGNVREWTSSHNQGNPEVVTRGGGWYYNSPAAVGAEYRSWDRPEMRSATVGFRCARGR